VTLGGGQGFYGDSHAPLADLLADGVDYLVLEALAELTLAIMQALVVESNKEGFAIPIADISEVIKFKPADIHEMNGKDVIELRGEALPLYYLSHLTKHGFTRPVTLPAASETPTPQPADSAPSLDELDSLTHATQTAAQQGVPYNPEPPKQQPASAQPISLQASKGFVVVVREANRAVGLVVDQLLGQEEAVVKPVSGLFDYNKAISGATIMGDGHVNMILDVPFLLKELVGKRG
jgi:two-component system chemotaxis sensor kinase CheA